MDVQMPEMNGVEASLAMRALEDVAEYLQAGMDGWIAKPVEVEKLYDGREFALSLRAPTAGKTAAA
jgi:CheY-like chemotaxis protein